VTTVEIPVTLVPLAELKLDEHNARTHSRRNLDAIKTSLLRFGQQKNLVVAADMTVIAGNGTVAVAREIEAEGHDHGAPAWPGMSESGPLLLAKVFPGSAEEARAYAIADNRTGELADWEEQVLAEQLTALHAADAALAEAAGFDAVEIDELTAQVAAAARHASSFGPPDFPGQVHHTGLAELREMYGSKATRALVFEYPNATFAWVIERLSEQRDARGLSSNAEAIVAVLAEVCDSEPPAVDEPPVVAEEA